MPVGLVTFTSATSYTATKQSSDVSTAAPASQADTASDQQEASVAVGSRVVFSKTAGHYITQTVNVDTGTVVSQTPSEGILRMQELLQSWVEPPKGGATLDTTT